MNEDQLADVTLAEREEEMTVGARALTRRLKELEARGASLRAGLADPPGWDVVTQIETLEADIYAARWGLYELTANAIGGDYNAADVALWCERAVKMGATHPRLDQALLLDLIHVRKVPNEPFRARFESLRTKNINEAQKKSLAVIIHRVLSGMEQERGENYGSAGLIVGNNPQGRTLDRWLGIQTYPGTGDHPPTLRLFISYEQAEALAVALDLSPHAAGI